MSFFSGRRCKYQAPTELEVPEGADANVIFGAEVCRGYGGLGGDGACEWPRSAW